MSVNYHDVKLGVGESYSGTLQFDEPLKDKWGNLKYSFPDKPDGTKVSWKASPQAHGMIMTLGLKKGDELKVEKCSAKNDDGMGYTYFKINGWSKDDIDKGKHLTGTTAPSSPDKATITTESADPNMHKVLENVQVHLDSASKLLDQVQSALSTTTKAEPSPTQEDDDDLPF